MTIGRAADFDACETLLRDARGLGLDRRREAVMRTLTLCAVHDDGRVTPCAEFALG